MRFRAPPTYRDSRDGRAAITYTSTSGSRCQGGVSDRPVGPGVPAGGCSAVEF